MVLRKTSLTTTNSHPHCDGYPTLTKQAGCSVWLKSRCLLTSMVTSCYIRPDASNYSWTEAQISLPFLFLNTQTHTEFSFLKHFLLVNQKLDRHTSSFGSGGFSRRLELRVFSYPEVLEEVALKYRTHFWHSCSVAHKNRVTQSPFEAFERLKVSDTHFWVACCRKLLIAFCDVVVIRLHQQQPCYKLLLIMHSTWMASSFLCE